jgi:hypothetical protein
MFTSDPITITHYSLRGTDPVPLEPNLTVYPKQKEALDLGITSRDEFDIILYLENNTKISKDNLKNRNKQETYDCPEGFVFVPGNYLYGTTYGNYNGFCVAKYEMKVDVDGDGLGDTDSNVSADCEDYYNTWYHYKNNNEDCNVGNYDIVSSAQGYPITRIPQYDATLYDAKQACESIGGHLITNAEWMTIVSNIASVPENWTSGKVGEGSLYTGNTSSCAVSGACYDGQDPDYGINRNETAKLVLDNRKEIWDLSGNVREWTDNTLTCENHPSADDNQSEWLEYSEGGYYEETYDLLTNYGSLDYKDLFLLSNKYNSSQGFGLLYSDKGDTATSERGFLRVVTGALALMLGLWL